MNKNICSVLLCLSILFVSCTPEETIYPDSSNYRSKQAISKKRGIGYNSLYAPDFITLAEGVSWAYNWDAGGFNSSLESVAKKSGVVYFPMVWNGSGNWADAIRNYKAAHPECEYILAYNEPNLTDQANMTPAQAAVKWNTIKSLAQELKMKIVAPAVNYGTLAGYSDPVKWYDDFFSQPGVSIDDVAALALHSYMPSGSALRNFVEMFRKYNKPLWMTEFCYDLGQNPTVEMQRKLMCDVLNYFEAEPMIERYAWFMLDPKSDWGTCGLRQRGNNSGEFTDLGKIYLAISSYDKEYHYGHNQVIPAEHYCNTNMSEVAGGKNWQNAVQLKLSTDETGILEVTGLCSPQWMEYKIEPVVKGDYHFIIRYASAMDSKCKILCDGKQIGEINLPKTGGYTTWKTITTSAMSVNKGKHTIRFAPSEGFVSMNWWRYKREGI